MGMVIVGGQAPEAEIGGSVQKKKNEGSKKIKKRQKGGGGKSGIARRKERKKVSGKTRCFTTAGRGSPRQSKNDCWTIKKKRK